MNTQGDRVGLIWSIAELLRHDYKPSEYGKVILPLRYCGVWTAGSRLPRWCSKKELMAGPRCCERARIVTAIAGVRTWLPLDIP
jgi:hypothetical protein